MRYDLGRGCVVRSENAAKPASQASRYLRELIRKLPKVEASLDYGCGKLRYFRVMAARSNRLILVDSEIQLSRQQLLLGKRTSVRDLTRYEKRIEVYNDQEFDASRARFDRAYCINVLSAIPSLGTRKRIIRKIASALKHGALCLFVVQYRNSDFSRMISLPNARKWRDGFLLDSRRGTSFYAQIDPHRLITLVRGCGLSVWDYHLNDGSIYLWARRDSVLNGKAQQRKREDVIQERFC
jgi:SAM-dependent methyltransferase